MALISIIVPAFEAAETIEELLSSLRAGISSHDREIIVVDDGSSDGTATVVEDIAAQTNDAHTTTTVIRNPVNRGAGECRNIGMRFATGEYLLFVDADDILAPGVIDAALSIDDAARSDFIVFPYHYVREERALTKSGMLLEDKKLWDNALRVAQSRAVEARKVPSLVLMTNYPWNKLIRRDFADRIGLRFSSTPVNNDIAAHWQLYTSASRIYLHDSETIYHFVRMDSSQITRVFDERRFSVFSALSETTPYVFASEQSITLFYEHFMRFKLKLLLWIYRRLPAHLYGEFFQRVEDLYSDLTEDALAFLMSLAPDLAASSVALSVNPSEFFAGKK